MQQLFSKVRTRGFTIIELLIVIVVIGILAAITIVAYNGVQNSARDKSVLSDMDAVADEITRYSVNNGGVYGSAIAWYSGGSANPNIHFTPSSGNVIDVVANTGSYCIRAYNPTISKNSITNAYTKGSSSDACTVLAPSVAAGGSGDSALIAWWKLDGDATDSSGNGNNAAVSGATLTAGQNGQSNGAYSFDGVSSHIDSILSISGGDYVHSISLWIYPRSFPPSRVDVFTMGAASNNTYSGVELHSDQTSYWYFYNNDTGYATAIPPNQWILLSFTYSGGGGTTSNKKFYVNGSPVTTTGSGANYGQVLNLPTSSPVGIGYDRARTTAYFNGNIDDVRIYNRVLSAAEISALYTNGAQ